LFGGVTAFSLADFVLANGYANIYWGWGNEDDDMYRRVLRQLNKTISRYPMEIARYQMIRTHGHRSARPNPYRDRILHSNYKFELDGLQTIQYRRHGVDHKPLFTLINVTLFPESYEQMLIRLKLSPTGKG
jgi:hypothetical protein